jgi:hypothetical protein
MKDGQARAEKHNRRRSGQEKSEHIAKIPEPAIVEHLLFDKSPQKVGQNQCK